jgi:predicted secreted protein
MAQKALGTKLKKGTTAIADLTSISGLEISGDTIEVTTLDATDGFREYIGGLKDPGEVGLSGYHDATGHKPLYDDLVAGTVNAYSIEFPDGSKWTFDGIVTGYTTGAELEDAVSFEATLKVTGKPELVLVTP